jgi:O-antigen ligase
VASRSAAQPLLPTWDAPALPIAALLSALMVGVLLSRNVPLGLAGVVGLCYAPLVMLNLRLGMVLWVPLTFLEGVHLFNLSGKAAGLLIALAWLGTARTSFPVLSALVERHRRTFAVLIGFLVWITLSALWAASPGAALADLWHWYAVGLIFVVIATVATDATTVRFLMHGFIVGGVLSVVAGMILGGLGSSQVNLMAAESGRLYGAAGDPNILAAGLVSAAVFAGGLVSVTRRGIVRLWLLLAAGVLVIGIAASQSRGGFLAVGATIFAALLFYRGRRAYVLLLVLLIGGVTGAWLASSPAAWDRLTKFEDGSGRTDIWRVATRVISAHPIAGVGLNNFEKVSHNYTRRPGTIKSIEFIVDTPRVAHNMYLETASDGGFVGLGLFLSFIVGCLWAAWAAGRRFDRLGERELEALATTALVACLGFLAASAFLSAGVDKRLWIMLALGPALYGIAVRRTPGRQV